MLHKLASSNDVNMHVWILLFFSFLVAIYLYVHNIADDESVLRQCLVEVSHA